MNKKLKILLITLPVVIAVWLGVVLLTGNNVTDYNTAATKRAQAGQMIGARDILILKSIEKNPGGDSKAEFYIYRLPEGAKAEDYLHLQVSKIGADSPLEHMGTASCTFIGDDPSAIHNLKAVFLK